MYDMYGNLTYVFRPTILKKKHFKVLLEGSLDLLISRSFKNISFYDREKKFDIWSYMYQHYCWLVFGIK